MGAEFPEVDYSRKFGLVTVMLKRCLTSLIKTAELYAEQTKDVDIIITHCVIPGRPAPKLVANGWLTQ